MYICPNIDINITPIQHSGEQSMRQHRLHLDVHTQDLVLPPEGTPVMVMECWYWDESVLVEDVSQFRCSCNTSYTSKERQRTCGEPWVAWRGAVLHLGRRSHLCLKA
ncbi:hypothetical protein E2C01_017063 [Portunus trituberculatus]|uniref:Uncharacterized protein n=1 Tax=Portunus trituberculatus TaxID=210409 RepID=A0A5B7DSL5_PORTR|nr:hypothetical protein [Portunus trituberculatus]